MGNTSATVRHYDAETARRGVFRHLLPLPGYPKLIWEHRFMVANFFRRELLGRFRGSVLGIFWVLVQPVFMFAVYFMVFGMLFGNWKWGMPPDPGFALYLFSGMIAFQALIEGTSGACTVVVGNSNLVKKVAFPSELLPVPGVMVAMTVYLVGAGVCLIAGLLTSIFMPPGLLQPGPMLLLLPLVMLVQFVMTLGIGLLLANLQVFARDVNHLWRIIGMAWMFLSPVFWFPFMMREKFAGMGGWFADLFFALNPAYPLLQANRIVLGAVDSEVVGRGVVRFGNFWGELGVASLWALFFLALGYSVFMSRRHKFADLV